MVALGGVLGIVLVAVIAVTSPAPPSVLAPAGPAASAAASGRAGPPEMAIEEVYGRFGRLGPVTSGGSAAQLSVSRAGDLVLQTGRVVAADVFLFDNIPFTRWLPSGTHPVFVLHATAASDDRIAAAMIRVAPGDPVRWEPALTPGQDASRLPPDQFFGYGVDSGIGCFTSAEAVEYLSRAGARAGDAYSARVQAAMFPSKNEFHLVADIPLGDGAGLNVVAFQSGWGDGGYASYFGLDAAGKPLVLVTNFGIIDGS
jgi:Protein of unknown function (DUF4241)